MTVEELYQFYIDETKPFEEDIFDFFELGDKGWDKSEWMGKYGMYFPEFDFAGTELAERKRDNDYKKAMDTLDLTQKATDRVYATELDTLSTELGREMKKGEFVAGGLGLRSGSLESAVGETIGQAGAKTKDLGDRLMISDKEMLDKYNIAMVDTALDFDKTKRQEKEEFYDRTMKQIMRLTKEEPGTFGEFCPEDTPIKCGDSSCVALERLCPEYVDACGDPNGLVTDATQCVGYTTPKAHEAACTSRCAPYEGDIGEGGSTCMKACMEANIYTDPIDSYVTLTSSEGEGWSSGTWFEDNRDYVMWNRNCTDEATGEWLCLEDEEGAHDQGCIGCSLGTINTSTNPSYPKWESICRSYSGGTHTACDPGCCPG